METSLQNTDCNKTNLSHNNLSSDLNYKVFKHNCQA